MRSPFHPPLAAHRSTGAVGHAGCDCATAEALLGAGHPLVGLLHRSETVSEQLVAVTVVEAAVLVLLVGDVGFGGSLAIAGLAVQVGLGCRLAAHRARRRELCLGLIAEGRQAVPLVCIERECRRLLDPRTREKLATSVDEMLDIAARRLPPHPAARPIFHVHVVRRVVLELRQIASLLRSDDPCVRGVAAVELLLTSPATPLYGTEVEPLRQELWRVRYRLDAAP